jgi:hypothetical protein
MSLQDMEKMVRRGLRIDLELWEQAKTKAGLIPISVIIRLLLKKWIKGEINLE